MIRMVLRVDGKQEEIEVGDDWQSFNKIIHASMGEIVRCYNSKLILWVDEEGRCKKDYRANLKATVLSGAEIVGDAIVLNQEDID